MCNHCTQDPRDRIHKAERALWGLRVLLSEMPDNVELPADCLETLVGMVHDHLDGSAMEIQDYVPRNFDPRNV